MMHASPPAQDDDQQIIRRQNYLAERDVPCPQCGYNLRNCKAANCPECGVSLSLRNIDDLPAGVQWRIGLLSALGSVAIVGGLVLLAFLVASVGAWAPAGILGLIAVAIGFLSYPILGTMLVRRRAGLPMGFGWFVNIIAGVYFLVLIVLLLSIVLQ